MGKQLILTEKQRVAKKFVTALDQNAARGAFCFEGDRHIIVFLSGHLLRLVSPAKYKEEWRKFSLPSLPIDPETFLFEPIPGNEKHFAAVKNHLLRSDIDSVVIATDCGREGEVIARLILQESGFAETRRPVFRFWTSGALTPEHVRETMGRLLPSKDKDSLFQSGLARMLADWLVGFNSTRALTCRFSRLGETMDMGRVKAVILRLLMQRQLERENFVPEDFWTIKGRFVTRSGAEFLAGWVSTGGGGGTGFLPEKPTVEVETDSGSEEGEPTPPSHEEGSRFRDKYEANRAVNRICCNGLTWQTMKESLRIKPNSGPEGPVRGKVVDVIGQVKKDDPTIGLKSVLPPQLFSLTTLQQEAHRLYGFSLDLTESIAQHLSLELDLITYPRTESTVLNVGMLDHAKLLFQVLEKDKILEFDPDLLNLEKESSRIFDDKQIVEDHHAIIPSGQPADMTRLNSDQKKIYQLIVRRFIAAFYPPYQYRSIRVDVQVGEDTFRASKTIVANGGWKEFYHGSVKPVGRRDCLEELSTDMVVSLKYLFVHHAHTNTPPMLNDATLLKALIHFDRYIVGETEPECTEVIQGPGHKPSTRETDLEGLKRALRASSGVGTPSSRGRIVREMIDNGMVYRLGRGKGLEVQEKGRTAYQAIEHLEALGYETSARWELALTNIARGQGENLTSFVSSVRLGMRDLVENVRAIPQALADELNAIGVCPLCAAPVVEMAKSYSCRNYPQCNFALWKNRLAPLGKEEISLDEARTLLEGGSISLKKLQYKNGKTFDATGTLSHSPEHGWGVAFDAKGKPPSGAPAPVSVANPPTVVSPKPPQPAAVSPARPPVRPKDPAPVEMACCQPKGVGSLPTFRRPGNQSDPTLEAAATFWLGTSMIVTKGDLLQVLRQIKNPLSNAAEALSKQGISLEQVPLPKGVSSLWDLVRRGESLATAEWMNKQGIQANFGIYQRIRYVSRAGEGEGVIQELRPNNAAYVVICKEDSGGDNEACIEREIPYELTCCYRCKTPGARVEG